MHWPQNTELNFILQRQPWILPNHPHNQQLMGTGDGEQHSKNQVSD